MHNQRKLPAMVLLSLIVFSILQSACNLSSNTNAAAQTVTAAITNLTETAKAAPTSTSTPQPTSPPIPTQPPLAQPTATPEQPNQTEEPAPGGPTLIALENTNCRIGPDPAFQVTGYFVKNMESRILGTNENNSWWLIEDPAKAGQNCWVQSLTTKPNGDTSSVPYVPSPPLPEEYPIPYVEP